MSWIFLISILLSGICDGQSSSSSSSSSADVSSSSSVVPVSSSPSSAESSSSVIPSSSSVVPSSSSAVSSSSVSACQGVSGCSDCFDSEFMCSWDFAGGACADGPMMLPFPLSSLNATKDYCGAMETCLMDINPASKFYENLFDTWKTANSDKITALSTCLNDADQLNCTESSWDSTAYDKDCTSGNISKAEICQYSTSSSWPKMIWSSLLKLRRLLQSSSSSSSSSDVSSSSSVIPSSSSAATSAVSSSSSAASSSVIPSSSSLVPPSTNKSFAYGQSYCIPSTCSANIAAHFKDIYEPLFDFTLPSPAVPTDLFSCAVKPTPKPSKGLSGGAIAGIVIGCLVGVLLLGFLGWNMCGKSREPNEFQAM